MPLFGRPKFASVTYIKKPSNLAGPTDIAAETVSKEKPKDTCKGCNGSTPQHEVTANLGICPKCEYHNPMTAMQRITLLSDANSFRELDSNMKSVNRLGFEGYDRTYLEKVKSTGHNDAIVTGLCKLDGQEYAIGVMDFRFMGASMGSVVGEKLTRLTEAATSRNLPLLIVTASGGARMQEGCLSLMQMAKTSGALARHSLAGLPVFILLTNPTYGGVTASFASLGDIILAEPKALIGFAGARVIQTTIKAELPPDFQTAEFLEKRGLVDRIIHRKGLRRELSLLFSYFKPGIDARS